MRRVRLLALALLFPVGCAADEPARPKPEVSSRVYPAVPASLVQGNTGFALDLYRQLAKREGNLFFSPYSISTALAMTYAGARGKTAEEMAAVLHFPGGDVDLHAAFRNLVGELERKLNQSGNELTVANALWGQKGYQFLAEFLALTNKHYGAGLHEVDYVGAVEEARQTINRWVEDKTKEKIRNLIPEGTLDAQTRLVLTNAIYFLGQWAEEFDQKNTADAPFTLADGEKVNVPMMNRKAEFGYMEDENLQLLELPYSGEDASMLIFLPKAMDGLAELESTLATDTLAAWTGKLHQREVVVAIPKFKLTHQFTLTQTLADMGMQTAFSGDADFSGMTGKRDLFISDVIHKAFVDVNEKGTEAAAATAVVMRLTAALAPLPVFRADHPFLFVIRDQVTGSILFMGRVTDPRS